MSGGDGRKGTRVGRHWEVLSRPCRVPREADDDPSGNPGLLPVQFIILLRGAPPGEVHVGRSFESTEGSRTGGKLDRRLESVGS